MCWLLVVQADSTEGSKAQIPELNIAFQRFQWSHRDAQWLYGFRWSLLLGIWGNSRSFCTALSIPQRFLEKLVNGRRSKCLFMCFFKVLVIY